MNDTICMQVFDPFHNLFEIIFSLFLLDFTFFLQKAIKITIFAKFSDDVHIVSSLIDVVEFYNVWMIDFFHNFNFWLNVFNIVAVSKKSLVNNFDCNFLPSLNNFSFVDISIRTLSKKILHTELIFLYPFLSFHHFLVITF